MADADRITQRDRRVSHPPPPHNLPIPPTPFIGRRNEVVAAADLLRHEDVRFITLTGPPGIGKTRLAIEVARRLLTDFAHGVYFINLAPITDPHLVLPTIAHRFGLSQATDHPLIEELKDFLANRLWGSDNASNLVFPLKQPTDSHGVDH